jgi:hypothetical protein
MTRSCTCTHGRTWPRCFLAVERGRMSAHTSRFARDNMTSETPPPLHIDFYWTFLSVFACCIDIMSWTPPWAWPAPPPVSRDTRRRIGPHIIPHGRSSLSTCCAPTPTPSLGHTRVPWLPERWPASIRVGAMKSIVFLFHLDPPSLLTPTPLAFEAIVARVLPSFRLHDAHH